MKGAGARERSSCTSWRHHGWPVASVQRPAPIFALRGEPARIAKSVFPCLIGIEACASSHYWSRELAALGHTVRLTPPVYDATDAEAICEANMRFVATKTSSAVPEPDDVESVRLAAGIRNGDVIFPGTDWFVHAIVTMPARRGFGGIEPRSKTGGVRQELQLRGLLQK